MADLNKTLDALRDLDTPLAAATIYSLSDLSAADLKTLATAWESIPDERRQVLVTRLGEISETNFDLDFAAVGKLALDDSDGDVRATAIEALWYDESPDLLQRMITLAQHDVEESVRAAALVAMGRFIYLGEIESVDEDAARRAQDVALAIYNDVDELTEVRRRAVEALGSATRPDLTEIIQEAYESDEAPMRASALFAMGRSFDQDWAPIVLEELTSDDPEMRYEAARSAGELELEDAIPFLASILLDDDREVIEVAIAALGEIGGGEARALLENAIERAQIAEDEELVEAIQEALELASLVGENLDFGE